MEITEISHSCPHQSGVFVTAVENNMDTSLLRKVDSLLTFGFIMLLFFLFLCRHMFLFFLYLDKYRLDLYLDTHISLLNPLSVNCRHPDSSQLTAPTASPNNMELHDSNTITAFRTLIIIQ